MQHCTVVQSLTHSVPFVQPLQQSGSFDQPSGVPVQQALPVAAQPVSVEGAPPQATPTPTEPQIPVTFAGALDFRGRLFKPHDYFPFDLHDRDAAYAHLDDQPELKNELEYVSDHCMVPPFPWGHIIYHNFIVGNLRHVPGDFAEFGTGLGGTSVFLARLAKQMGKKCLAVDSFEGLPEPDFGKDNHYFVEGDYRPPSGLDNYDRWMQYKSRFDVDDNLYTIKAFFKDAVIPDEFETFSFVHMDSDLYDSVYDSLDKVWDRLSPGGAVAIDDFFHHAQGPARAVADFCRLKAHCPEPPILHFIPTYAVLIVKGESAFLQKQFLGEGHGFQNKMVTPRALDGNFYSFQLVRSCKPFLLACRESVARARAAHADAVRGQNSLSVPAIQRVVANAESFLGMLTYPEDAPKSGCDILRYLSALEDLLDIRQGSLCGMPGEARKTIEIQV